MMGWDTQRGSAEAAVVMKEDEEDEELAVGGKDKTPISKTTSEAFISV